MLEWSCFDAENTDTLINNNQNTTIMKETIVKMMLCTVALFGSTATFAQTDATTGATAKKEHKSAQKYDASKVAEHQTEHMAKELSLTPEQKAKVLEITKKYAALKPGKELFAKKDAEIGDVLTAEQKTKYTEYLKKVAEFRKRTAGQRKKK